MRCPDNCICGRCYNVRHGGNGNGIWDVVHLRGQVIVRHMTVAPAEAMAMAEAIKSAAADAQQWRDEQGTAEAIAPETKRSEATNTKSGDSP